jgi:hypothetical protein
MGTLGSNKTGEYTRPYRERFHQSHLGATRAALETEYLQNGLPEDHGSGRRRQITVNAELSLNVPNYPIILSAEMMLRCSKFGDAIISHI